MQVAEPAPPVVAAPPLAPAPMQLVASAPPAADAPARSPSQWYGWQTLIAVAPFDIALFVGMARNDNRITATGFIGRNVAPSVVHMINKRPGVGFATLGLHAASAATGLVVGYAIGLAVQRACPPGDVCRYGMRELPPGLGYGAVAGSMVGTVLDVVFLARRPRATWDGSSNNTVAFTPFAAPSTLGVAAGGTF
ncbi:Hypothetical protein A7982_06706 [Minicystis rosea]|nr:Hypothetical protein A7982_06706 [Minicystis rosea]